MIKISLTNSFPSYYNNVDFMSGGGENEENISTKYKKKSKEAWFFRS